MAFHVIFGSENAETDELLYECAVEDVVERYTRPILTGRWGMGKTGVLLLQNKHLTDFLEKRVGKLNSREWYLRERALDIELLLQLQMKYENDAYFRRVLEKIWFAEILRIYSRVILLILDENKKNEDGHWGKLWKLKKAGDISKSLWKQAVVVGNLLSKVIHGTEIDNSLIKEGVFSDLLNEKLYRAVWDCLIDIQKEYGIFISIAIEPIETPESDLENSPRLANNLVAALLNTFRNYFEPSAESPFYVRITIPWHRFSPELLDFPQKLYAYKENIIWTQKDLSEFINKRIEWEFRRVQKRYRKTQLVWYDLFPKEIPNGVTNPTVMEDSFLYILRHTHHRPRDIQRLTREIVEYDAKCHGVTPDFVLQRRSPISIDSVKNALRATGPKLTELLIVEGKRRHHNLYTLTEQLRGLSIPFTENDLNYRMRMTDISINEAISILWDTGIMGFSICSNFNSREDERLKNNFSSDIYRTEYPHVSMVSWNWFEYNYQGDPITLVENLKSIIGREDILTLHPLTFEYFTPRNFSSKCPIGT